MIIDSNAFRGPCTCGKAHAMTTEFCIIEPGCLKRLPEYLLSVGLVGHCAAIYDENTYAATADLHPEVLRSIVLPAHNLHADNHGVTLALAQLTEQYDFLIAVGAGTIHDITRYCAYEKGIPFVSCPTAASVDGFCSSVAAMTWNGYKKTFSAVAPKLVVADTDIIAHAPIRLAKSGFGDMVGKYIALADWKVGHLLTGEHFCQQIYDVTYQATQAVLDSATGIINGDPAAYERLTYGLLMSGVAMQLLGSSRCASGAEHHISHLIEMEPPGLGVHSDALHGEKVGIGTLLACQAYHALAQKDLPWHDYVTSDQNYIRSMFGQKLSGSILTENKTDAAAGITAETLHKHFDALSAIINEIPSYDSLVSLYKNLAVKSTLPEIGVPAEAVSILLECSPLVRNRLTLMRLRRCLL
ncbi:MAG: sn-glycerol-1-phosphate dehydrogenase [Ruminococcaceae bacterium]|nr:sn-glycerol-1-phosphate dehydrogenase [Oscillospiraceae bacterium]